MKSITTLFIYICIGLISTESVSAVTDVTSEMLVHRTWVTSDVEGYDLYFEFHEPAILDIIKDGNGETTWDIAHWSLFNRNGVNFIQIRKDRTVQQDQYQIILQAGQLILIYDDGAMVLKPSFSPAVPKILAKPDLIGKWKSPFYNKRSGKIAKPGTQTARMWKVVFEFKKDGTFQRYLQLGKYVEAESGVWTLTDDAKFLKLHFTLKGEAENIYKREILSIDEYSGASMNLSSNEKIESSLSEFKLRKE